jgi:hypothetical protein
MLRNEAEGRVRLSFGAVPYCVLGLVALSGKLRRYLAEKYLDEGAFDPPNAVSAPKTRAESSERFLWQQRKRDELKTMRPSCRRCRRHERCEGVWKTYVALYGFSEFRPVAPPEEPRAEGRERKCE